MIITPPQIEAEVRRLAEERPDFNYKDQDPSKQEGTSCSYVGMGMLNRNEGEGCIFGQALQNLGILKEVLQVNDGPDIVIFLQKLEIPVYSSMMRDWFSRVQFMQDTGRTWREAVDYADELRLSDPEWEGE